MPRAAIIFRGLKSEKPSANPNQIGSTKVQLSPGRKWFFRLTVVLILPLLVFGLLETGLRLADYGYPTSFFVSKEINGKRMRVENAWFGLRFFPPALVRSPYPVVMEAEKPPGVYRIFLFGESAALGDPRPAYGVGRYLEVLLRERFPGSKFEVICTAMTAINSHVILPIAQECAQYQGDLWIVYMGNNEQVGPFGATTVFGAQVPSRLAVRAYLALQRLRIGQWMVYMSRFLQERGGRPVQWGGMKMFLDRQIPPDAPSKERIYENFRRNLDGIIQAGRKAGVPVILSGMAVNLNDCAPFCSVHGTVLSSSELARWQAACQAGETNAAQGNWPKAAPFLEEAVQVSPQYAESYFRLGQCYLAMANRDAAKRSFVRARDLDALPFRADSRINDSIQAAAQRYTGQRVSFLDIEKVFEILNSGQVPGQEFLHEHVHLNFNGNYCLARALAEKVLDHLPAAVFQRQTPEWAGLEICARRLGLTDWNRLTVFEEMARRLSDAPFTNQFNHSTRMKHLASQINQTRLGLKPGAVPETRAIYEEAIRQRPQDFWLHHNYAEFLKEIGDLPEAVVQMQKVRDLTPQNSAAPLQLGRLYTRLSKYDEARQALEEAMRLRPDLGMAYLELGQVFAAQGKLEEALHHYAIAKKHQPDDATVSLRRAEVLFKMNKRVEAIQSLHESIRLRPSQWEAHYLLGVERAADGKNSEAQEKFETVLQFQSSHVPSHLNLGIVLARQAHFKEALQHFQEVLRLDPNHRRAREFISEIQQMGGSQPVL